jgi:hypothetical protein
VAQATPLLAGANPMNNIENLEAAFVLIGFVMIGFLIGVAL